MTIPIAKRFPWKPIDPLRDEEVLANGPLIALDALRKIWERYLAGLSPDQSRAIRRRSLRKLSVETGILERLYEIDWGLTLTLVAEGFAREVVERSGGHVDERTLITLRAQMDSLEMVLDFVREDRPLTPHFIRELHQAITRTQATYIVTDSLGRIVERELAHGEWKKEPNHVVRQDGSTLEYCPPEHVISEIDRFVQLYIEVSKGQTHPLVQASWLHHRFVQIHPFADGNGRVARAMTLLVLEKHHFAPLVVDRWHREAYLKALDAANLGDLKALTKLFVKLESAALTAELDRPFEKDSVAISTQVAHTLAEQLSTARRRKEEDTARKIVTRAEAVSALLKKWFDGKREEIRTVFVRQGLRDIKVFSDTEIPPDSDKNYWFKREVIESARTAGHYAEFEVFAGWSKLRVLLENGTQLNFVASLHGAGREPGVMAVTTFGLIELKRQVSAEETEPSSREQFPTTHDAFRFVHTETPAAIADREPELYALLEEGLAEALLKFMRTQ